MGSFNVLLQFAHHQHSENEEHWCTTPEEVTALFDAFDWAGETDKSNRLERVSPTLSVETRQPAALLWVSSIGDAPNLEFISEYTFPADTTRLFGLWSGSGRKTLHTSSFTLFQAREAVALFTRQAQAELLALYHSAGTR